MSARIIVSFAVLCVSFVVLCVTILPYSASIGKNKEKDCQIHSGFWILNSFFYTYCRFRKKKYNHFRISQGFSGEGKF